MDSRKIKCKWFQVKYKRKWKRCLVLDQHHSHFLCIVTLVWEGRLQYNGCHSYWCIQFNGPVRSMTVVRSASLTQSTCGSFSTYNVVFTWSLLFWFAVSSYQFIHSSNSTSRSHTLDMGVPQGYILTPRLFTNSVKPLNPPASEWSLQMRQ